MIYSSYYGNVENLFKMGFSKDDLVGISVYKCKWIGDIKYCKELMVSKSLLWEYKSGLIEWKDYCREYYDKLYSCVDMKFWWNFEKDFEGKVLLCFEKDFQFCHRKLVGKFYEWYFGKKIIKEI